VKRITTIAVFFVFAIGLLAQERREEGNLVIEGIPEIPETLQQKMQQYSNTRSASLRDWLADDAGMLIATRFGETTQFHTLAGPGMARSQITFYAEPIGGGDHCPTAANNGFLFTRDVGGGENYQIFFYDMDQRQAIMLSDGESRNGAASWSPDGEKISYYSTRRNQRDWDVYISDMASPQEPTMVYQATGTWVPVDWSPDGRELLLLNYVSAAESYYHRLDIASGEITQINPQDEKIAYGGAVYAKDGKGLFLTANAGSEFRILQYYDISSGELRPLTAALNWDVDGFDLSDDGQRLAFTANVDGMSKLYLMKTDNFTFSEVPDLPIGQIYGLDFAADNKRLGLVLNTHATPGDVHVLDCEAMQLERWTYSEVGGLDTDQFAAPELIRYPTFDEVDGQPRQIPAFVYRPKTVSEQPLPVLISIHGGPEAQFNPYFSSTFQDYLNEMGIAVIAPNVRGSAGYGKSYLQLDNGMLRENSVKDIGALLDWIATQPDLDAERVAVFGGSYGGYMVLASMIHFNDRIRAGVDIVGISNFVTFLENTKDYRRDLRRVEYGDERDPEMRAFLEKISPTNNAAKIRKPLFVVQGYNDPRVPVGEAEQIVEVVRQNGTEVWYLLAMDEGHGFRKKSNSDYYRQAVVLFLEKYLLN
jgi:dipeptidyl aminopeptidase/acylaminoacyl peptidase